MNTDTEKGSMMVRQLEISDIQNESNLGDAFDELFIFYMTFLSAK